jgi:hypothetical protein
LAPTREQAKISLSYIVGILEQSPILRKLVCNVTANFDLRGVRQNRLFRIAIAMIGAIAGRLSCLLRQMMIHLRIQHSLGQGLFQFVEQSVLAENILAVSPSQESRPTHLY